MQKFKDFLYELITRIIEVIGGFTLSGIASLLVPEIVHLFFIIIGGFVGTVTIHYTRKWLKE